MAHPEDGGALLELVDWPSPMVSVVLPPSSGHGPPPKALEQQRIIANVQTASGRVLFQRRLDALLREVPTVDRRTEVAARREDFGASLAPPLSPSPLTPIVSAVPPPAATTTATPTMGAAAPSPAPPMTPAPTETSPVGSS